MIQEPIQPQPSPSQYSFEEDSSSITDIILILAKHLKLIIITPTIFCIVTIIYALFFTSPSFISRAKFMSSGSGDNQSGMKGFASQFGFSLPHVDSSPQWSYEELIKSRTMAKSLLNRRFDTEEFGPQKELLQIVTYGNKDPEVGIETLIHTGIIIVQGMIKINTSGNMYELAISAFEPQLAADIAKAILEDLHKHQSEYISRKTTKTRQFIEDRLIDTKIELEATEEALKEFREQNRSILGSPQLQLEQERLTRNVAVLIGVFTTLKQQLETAKIDEVRKSDYVIILDEAETPLYPAKPKKTLMVIIAGFLGIGLGMVLAFIKEYANNNDEEEQEKISKLKSLVLKNITDFLPQKFRKT